MERASRLYLFFFCVFSIGTLYSAAPNEQEEIFFESQGLIDFCNRNRKGIAQEADKQVLFKLVDEYGEKPCLSFGRGSCPYDLIFRSETAKKNFIEAPKNFWTIKRSVQCNSDSVYGVSDSIVEVLLQEYWRRKLILCCKESLSPLFDEEGLVGFLLKFYDDSETTMTREKVESAIVDVPYAEPRVLDWPKIKEPNSNPKPTNSPKPKKSKPWFCCASW
jgi:hypothetical protein